MVNVATISPDSPGAYSVLARATVVHPQEDCTFCIFIGLLAVLVNLYLATIVLSSGVALKVCSVLSQVSWANAELAHKQNMKSINFIW